MVTSQRHTQSSSFQSNPSSVPTFNVMRGKISASLSYSHTKKKKRGKIGKFTYPALAKFSLSLLFKCVPLFLSRHVVHLVLCWAEHVQETDGMGGEVQHQMQGGEIFEWFKSSDVRFRVSSLLGKSLGCTFLLLHT